MISSFLRDIYYFFLYLFTYIIIINLLFLFLHVMLKFKIKMIRIPSMKKLYITDLDGTLLNQNASISPYLSIYISKQADAKYAHHRYTHLLKYACI